MYVDISLSGISNHINFDQSNQLSKLTVREFLGDPVVRIPLQRVTRKFSCNVHELVDMKVRIFLCTVLCFHAGGIVG